MNKTKLNSESNDINIFKELFVKNQVYKDVLSKKELWKGIAELCGGKFTIKQTINKDLVSFRLEIPYKNHFIILTETDTKPLKLETELKLNRRFNFNISWEGVVERVMKIFGTQDITIGDKEFDRKYLIQSDNPELLSQFLNFEQIKQSILKSNLYLLDLNYSEEDEYHKLLIVKDRNTRRMKEMNDLIKFEFSIIDFFIRKNLIRS